ncbi:hypothetical protein LMG27177_01174 [Paraburkholderia fynbosensis]|uniref:Uncharacterized protein n=1 Tax=Paraburkholderia fynbosensis TaxID=1200993 RepID=A0A6J5FNK3_9BURK|nr:hypothetical protein LMG27177_01174 [Paraburkholderia fynbosensis]
MKTYVKRMLMAGYSRGIVPAALVSSAFRWFDLARH